jgi:hypothetical protein
VSQGDRLERAGLEEGEKPEEEELEAEETLKRMGIEVVEEDEELEGEVEYRRVSTEARVQKMVEEHGKCRTSYILRVAYGMDYARIARLLGANVSTVRSCVAYYRKRDMHAELSLAPPLEAFKRYGELCGRDAYSLECQMLEAEMFMYNVARNAAPPTIFWSVFLRAASIHRLVFPEVYTLLEAYAKAGRADFRELLRAYRPRGSERWVAGDGVVAYVYTVLELAHYMLGYRSYRYSERLREAIGELTGKPEKDPLGSRIAPLTLQVSLKVNTVVGSMWSRVLGKERQLYEELLAALEERKGKRG